LQWAGAWIAREFEPCSTQGLKYEDLPDDLRLRFDTYNINIVIVSETDEDEVREMFLRL